MNNTINLNYDFVIDSLPERAEAVLHQQLINLLRTPKLSLTPVFQPIVSLRTHHIFAYEGLIRGPKNSELFRPDTLFEVADELNLTKYLDICARAVSAEKYKSSGLSPYLFLNTNALVIENIEYLDIFLSLLSDMEMPIDNLVLEITEQTPVSNLPAFMDGIQAYREKGFMFALDDLGTGYNGLKLWSQIQPDFVKIDKHFIYEVSKNPDKQHFIETIQALGNSMNTQVIAEGVETEADLEVIAKFGIPYAQGYLFAKPEENPLRNLNFNWDLIKRQSSDTEGKVAHLNMEVITITPDILVEQVVDLFHKHETLEYVPVISGTEVHGMIWRSKVMDMLASRYGRDLYAKKPITFIMDSNPIIVECDVAVEELSRTITDSKLIQTTDAFVITKDQQYHGCGNLYDLLRYITDLKIQNALYSNPLSGLPGNVPIQQYMQDWLDKKYRFSFLYIDLDNFKAFNDYYSFEQGDLVLKAISTLLQTQITDARSFLGHIGGDDFVILSRYTDEVAEMTSEILNKFDAMILNYYNADDVAQMGIRGRDRDGQEVLFPIMSLSIGIIDVEPGVINHQQQLSSVATRAKKQAKQILGSSFVKLTSTEALSMNQRIYHGQTRQEAV